MTIQDNLQEIKQTIQEFFNKASFDVEVQILPLEDKTIPIKINAEDPKVFIGQNGQTLADIQHLLKAMLSRKITEQFYVDFDVNNYKEKKMIYMKENAREWADEVVLSKKERALNPMPAFERRVIHMELANRTDIKTESAGQGIDRHIVITPC